LIIVRGRNHHPEDIEATVALAHAQIRSDRVVVFGVDAADADTETVVVAIEVHRRTAKSAYPPIIRAVRQAVIDAHDVTASAVVIVRPGGLPRTTSGKVQRSLCRDQYVAGTLPLARPPSETLALATSDEPAGAVELEIREVVAPLLQVPASHIGAQTPLTALGLDSLSACTLKASVEERFGRTITIARLLNGITISEMAAELPALPVSEAAAPVAGENTSEYPLSPGQQALWLLQRLDP